MNETVIVASSREAIPVDIVSALNSIGAEVHLAKAPTELAEELRDDHALVLIALQPRETLSWIGSHSTPPHIIAIGDPGPLPEIVGTDVECLSTCWEPSLLLNSVNRALALHELRAELNSLLELRDRRERQFQLFLDAACDYAFFFTDSSGKITEWNAGATRLLGYTADEVIGQSFELFFTAGDKAAGLPAVEMQTALREGQARDERWHLRKNGSRFYASGRLVALKDKAGTLQGFTKIFRDVTERRQMQDETKRREALFRALAQSVPCMVWLCDLEGRRHFVNDYWTEFTGTSCEECCGLGWINFLHPDEQVSVRTSWSELLARGEPFSQLHRYRRFDGEYCWHQVISRRLVIEDKQIQQWVGTCLNIHPLIEANENLLRTEEQLRLALASSEVGIWEYAFDKASMNWDNRTREIFGLRPDAEITCALFRTLVHPDDIDRVEQAIHKVLSGESTEEYQEEYRIIHPGHTVRQVRSKARPILSPGGGIKRLAGAVIDVTDTKQALEDLEMRVRQGYSQLQESTRRLEGFCYTVAHDLRAPLRAIHGYAELIRMESDPPPVGEINSYLQKIQEAAVRLDALIQDLLGYSRVEHIPVQLEPVSLDELCAAVIHEHGAEMKAKDASIHLEGPLGSVLADRTILRQVFQNLLSNALKYSKKGERASIRIYSRPMEEDLRLVVADEGIGIDPEYHHRVFRMFERIHYSDDYPGTGAGLAIVAKGVERMNGTVGFESSAGVGSSFWIQLKAAGQNRDQRNA